MVNKFYNNMIHFINSFNNWLNFHNTFKIKIEKFINSLIRELAELNKFWEVKTKLKMRNLRNVNFQKILLIIKLRSLRILRNLLRNLHCILKNENENEKFLVFSKKTLRSWWELFSWEIWEFVRTGQKTEMLNVVVICKCCDFCYSV